MNLPVFFKWFGSKRKLSRLLPEPLDNLPVFEPFAGSAGYSCFHGCQEVHLAERNTKVRELWQWLISEAKPSDIESIPHEQVHRVFTSRHVMNTGVLGGRLISELGLTEMQEILFRLWMNCPSHDGALRCARVPNHGGYFIKSTVDSIIAGLPGIKRWKVYADYRDLPNLTGTWEIDPPYQGVRDLINRFYCSDRVKLNYDELREWILSRKGLKIVHDVQGATYLPFVKLETRKSKNPWNVVESTEMVWMENSCGI